MRSLFNIVKYLSDEEAILLLRELIVKAKDIRAKYEVYDESDVGAMEDELSYFAEELCARHDGFKIRFGVKFGLDQDDNRIFSIFYDDQLICRSRDFF